MLGKARPSRGKQPLPVSWRFGRFGVNKVAGVPQSNDFPQSLYGGRLTIDPDAIAANWTSLSERLAHGARCGATVKADAYGTGQTIVGKRLAGEGCKTFFVALPTEGVELRRTLPDAEIYVLDGLFPGTAETLDKFGLRPVLGSLPEIEEWSAFCKVANRSAEAALHIDTGMHRLGITPDVFTSLMSNPELVGLFQPSLLMSHLACGSAPAHPMNKRQRDCFAETTAQFAHIPRSLANSAGVFLGQDYHFDLARPGISLYGGSALDAGAPPMTPTVKVEARIMLTRDVSEGDTIGYGGAQTANKAMRIAVVAAGYADGLLRRAGSSDEHSGGFAWLDGYRLPLAGRISMDMIALDVTLVPQNVACRGAFVEMLGPNVAAADLAAYAETIDYEYLTSLGRRYHRSYACLQSSGPLP